MTVSVSVELSPSPVNALEGRYRKWRESKTGQIVYPLFKEYALVCLHRGRRFGMKALAERVRWEMATTWEVKPLELKLNNNLIAYLGRELVRELPALAPLIEFRRVKEDA